MPTDGAPEPHDLAYLVVLDDVLVAIDIAETIRDFAPGAQVLVAANADEAMAALRDLAVLAQAFVALGPAAFDASVLSQGIAMRGGAVVLLGDAAEEAAATPWPVLQRPFGRDSLIGHLRNPAPPSAA